MMAADMNDDPIKRFEYDHLTRKAVLHSLAIRSMIKAARGLDDEQPEVKESEK